MDNNINEMKNRLILVSGMTGTGKTTFANYLATKLNMVLVCYDEIKGKEWDIIHRDLEELNALSLYGKLSYDFFWFFAETIMKSNASLILEYFFHPMHKETLDILTSKYDYKTIMVHFDSDVEIAYKRFMERNNTKERNEGLRVTDIDYESFLKTAKPNQEFSFGKYRIVVNTNHFSQVSYESIVDQIECILKNEF